MGQGASDNEARPKPLHPYHVPCSDRALGSTWLVLSSLEPVHSFLGAFIQQLFFSAPTKQYQARFTHGSSNREQDRLLGALHYGVLGPIREDHMFQITPCFHFITVAP